jgi:hypothetical protein
MREEFNPFIIFCITRPDSYRNVPAAKTESIGLQAYARVVMVFASTSGQFYLDMTDSAHLSGLLHLDNFIMTRRFSFIYRDWAKTIQ